MESEAESGPGRVVGGRYRLVAQVGAGGFGRVWEAHDQDLDVPVAVKEVWLPQQAGGEATRPEQLARAAREARNAARLREHPHVVPVHDVVVEDGRPWIVMRLVRGSSLEERLRDGVPLPAPQVRELALALLSALGAAHKAGIVHRDLKPANVLLTDEGEVLLTDFGIAVHEGDTRLTGTGGVIGSAEYMAPERLNGAEDQPAGDLFSLGATLYEAVEGISPFRRDTPTATMAAVVLHAPPPMRNGSGVLAALINALLGKEPVDRPTVGAGLAMLRTAASEAAAASGRTGPSPSGAAPPGPDDPTAVVPAAPLAPTAVQPPGPTPRPPSAGPAPLLAEERRRIREEERPADRFRVAVYWFMAMFVTVLLVSVVVRFVAAEGYDYKSSEDGYPHISELDADEIDSQDAVVTALLVAQVVLGLGLVTSWVLWFARVRALADRFAPGRLRYHPAAAVYGWLVPFGNLFVPKQIADDIWHASSPAGQGTRPASSRLLHLWWVAWLAALLTSPLLWIPWSDTVITSVERDAYTFNNGQEERYSLSLGYVIGPFFWSTMAAHLLTLPVASVTVLFMRRLTAMQEARLRG